MLGDFMSQSRFTSLLLSPVSTCLQRHLIKLGHCSILQWQHAAASSMPSYQARAYLAPSSIPVYADNLMPPPPGPSTPHLHVHNNTAASPAALQPTASRPVPFVAGPRAQLSTTKSAASVSPAAASTSSTSRPFLSPVGAASIS